MTSTNRLTGDFANVPTLRDLGMDVAGYGWTVVLAPKGITPAQVRYWEDMIAKAAQTSEWKAYLAFNHWTYTVQRSSDATRYLAAEHEHRSPRADRPRDGEGLYALACLAR